MESLDPYRNEGSYDTPESRKQLIEEYKKLEERRIYLAHIITKVWPLSNAVEINETPEN